MTYKVFGGTLSFTQPTKLLAHIQFLNNGLFVACDVQIAELI